MENWRASPGGWAIVSEKVRYSPKPSTLSRNRLNKRPIGRDPMALRTGGAQFKTIKANAAWSLPVFEADLSAKVRFARPAIIRNAWILAFSCSWLDNVIVIREQYRNIVALRLGGRPEFPAFPAGPWAPAFVLTLNNVAQLYWFWVGTSHPFSMGPCFPPLLVRILKYTLDRTLKYTTEMPLSDVAIYNVRLNPLIGRGGA